jgi:hypothetical protein
VPALVAEVIIAEIADHVRGDEPYEYQNEGWRRKPPVGGSEQPGDDRRLRRDHQNDAAGGIEKLRDRVQLADLFDAWPMEAGEGPDPKLKLRSVHLVHVGANPLSKMLWIRSS